MNQEWLPVFDTFKQALCLTQRHSKTLLRFNLPWLIVSLLGTAFNQFTKSIEQPFVGQEWLSMVLLIATLVATVMAAVASHRTILLGEVGVSGLPVLRWSHRETSFFAWTLFVSLSALFILIPFLLAGFFLMPVLVEYLVPLGPVGWFTALMPIFVFAAFFVARWSLVLPAVALDEREGSFKWAWQLSKGNAWRLMLLILLLPVLAGFFKDWVDGSGSILLALLLDPLWVAAGVLEIGVLSLSYKFLLEQKGKNYSVQSDPAEGVLE